MTVIDINKGKNQIIDFLGVKFKLVMTFIYINKDNIKFLVSHYKNLID